LGFEMEVDKVERGVVDRLLNGLTDGLGLVDCLMEDAEVDLGAVLMECLMECLVDCLEDGLEGGLLYNLDVEEGSENARLNIVLSNESRGERGLG
jgi:hypothetical protein